MYRKVSHMSQYIREAASDAAFLKDYNMIRLIRHIGGPISAVKSRFRVSRRASEGPSFSSRRDAARNTQEPS